MPIPYRLKGKTILIGRGSDNQQRLVVAVSINGLYKSCAVEGTSDVPSSINNFDMATGSSHCIISVNSNDDIMTLRNTNPLNRTFVDDVEIECYNINEKSKIFLSDSFYEIKLHKVLSSASNLVQTIDPGTYKINALEKVWNTYKSGIDSINRRKKMVSNFFSLPMALSALIGLMGKLFNLNELGNVGIIVTILILLAFVARFIISANGNDKKMDELNHYLIDNYKCPNPDCSYSFGKQDFYAVKKLSECPKCKCHYKYSNINKNT